MLTLFSINSGYVEENKLEKEGINMPLIQVINQTENIENQLENAARYVCNASDG